jgi:DNA-binding GntR family transcriptional regulator
VSATPLQRVSVVDTLATSLRERILDGELPAGLPLREVDLSRAYDVSRHTLRAAFRVLAAEGLVRIEPNRGASVARLEADEVAALLELRTALEVEAARLALERGDGRLTPEVHRAVATLAALSRRPRVAWRRVAGAHAAVHRAIVAAASSPRIEASYAQLAAELQLFLVQLRPVWPLERMASHHEQLVAGLEREGPEALRRHLREGADAVLAGSAPAARDDR